MVEERRYTCKNLCSTFYCLTLIHRLSRPSTCTWWLYQDITAVPKLEWVGTQSQAM